MTNPDQVTALSCGNWRPCDYDYLDVDDRWLIDNVTAALGQARAEGDQRRAALDTIRATLRNRETA